MSQPLYNQWGNYRTYLFTDQAVNLINSHDTSKPLFLYLAHEAVHSALGHEPLEAPQNLIDKFKNRIHDENRGRFAAMATALDQSIGKVHLVQQYELMKDKASWWLYGLSDLDSRLTGPPCTFFTP